MSGGSSSLSLVEGGSSVQDRPDLGLQGLVLLAQFHGVAADAVQLAHGFGRGGEPFDETTLLLAAKQLGLKARVVAQPAARIGMAALPALALVPEGDAFIVAKVGVDQILIHDLVEKRPRSISPAEFEARYQGRLLQVASRASVLGDLAKFDFSWFIPAVVKYRKLMIEVFVVSFFIQLFALITPLFYQVVMDKVLVHNGLTTLDVIAIGLVSMAIFDVLLSGLRTYVFAHTTSKIDVELGARLFRHVLSLPLYATISGLITPVLRKRLNDKFARGADNQSFLVETVSGIGTVKAMAVDPRVTRTWDNQLAGYVSAGFNVTRIATLGQQGVQLVQKLTAVAVLFWGAKLVMEGKLSIGQLIAFNMLSGQVTAPIIRLAQLWQDFQQVGISVERLGDILNTRTEVPGSRLALPPIRGQVTFERVTFRYRPDAPEVLNGIELDIRPGEIIGIVGRSGSGKSTLTKLVQRLYTPERGRVLIDGQDLALADPAWLRRQLGVVLQENFLFNRSVRQNIALSDPGMPLERVIHAAKLAGAHDFILELPEGYDTKVGEHGTGLSGGQRQRIAIARALIGDPRILILDEATSALDYESEHAVMSNMRAICKGRTVLIIAHRLSTVRQANRIVVVEKGRIVESGSHAELVDRPEGQYSHLYRLQQGTP
ncbi:ATP-binding cassette domain-containing protein [Xanthomonas citri]|uniref:ATP-binding cassette domain-containing protein n=1 Tax=Xanthomonas citri TaxID=346 RepID=UPI0009C246EC|nr:ATP-binding cassette domain-containing protein [Xanthomonas citri]AMV01770.1 peptidase C39 [Xanthomonas citri pv. aurantifolii]TBW99804.1 peptidase C39 [Xanthomonas citri pv. aurantifolii]